MKCGPVLGLAGCHIQKLIDWQVRDKGTPSSYHHGKAVFSLVDDCQTMHPPPAFEIGLGNKLKIMTRFQIKTST